MNASNGGGSSSLPSANVAGSPGMKTESIKINTLRVHRVRRRKQNRRVIIPGFAAGFEKKKRYKSRRILQRKTVCEPRTPSKTCFSFDMFGLLATLALAATSVVQGV